ncbi:hypothetical protein AWRI1499_3169 [Brettanomyces bruxellensis AWRI1499]|nr:hypothetical protein AWRI1499_3169 [Brettanomyces bruxellensis AWRI1499]
MQPPEDRFEDRTQLKQQLEEAPVEPVAVPVENTSSYAFAGVMCLLIAFGGFVFGWVYGYHFRFREHARFLVEGSVNGLMLITSTT